MLDGCATNILTVYADGTKTAFWDSQFYWGHDDGSVD